MRSPHLHPEFGYLCPTPGLRRMVRMALAFTVIGVVAGAGGMAALIADHETSLDSAAMTAHVDPPSVDPLPGASAAAMVKAEASPLAAPAVRIERVKLDAGKDRGKSDLAKSELAKSDLAKSEATKSQPAKSEASKPEARTLKAEAPQDRGSQDRGPQHRCRRDRADQGRGQQARHAQDDQVRHDQTRHDQARGRKDRAGRDRMRGKHLGLSRRDLRVGQAPQDADGADSHGGQGERCRRRREHARSNRVAKPRCRDGESLHGRVCAVQAVAGCGADCHRGTHLGARSAGGRRCQEAAESGERPEPPARPSGHPAAGEPVRVPPIRRPLRPVPLSTSAVSRRSVDAFWAAFLCPAQAL